jgi:hypothetical protein
LNSFVLIPTVVVVVRRIETMKYPDISTLSLSSPAPVDYSSDEDSVIVVGHATAKKKSVVIDLTGSDEDEDSNVMTHEQQSRPRVQFPSRCHPSTMFYTHKEIYAVQKACEDGDLKTVKRILEGETDPIVAHQLLIDLFHEPFHHAIVNDRAEVVRYLLGRSGEFSTSYVEIAMKHKSYGCLKVLTEMNWDINKKSRSFGHPPYLS